MRLLSVGIGVTMIAGLVLCWRMLDSAAIRTIEVKAETMHARSYRVESQVRAWCAERSNRLTVPSVRSGRTDDRQRQEKENGPG